MIDVRSYPASHTLLGRIIRSPLHLVPKRAVVPILQGPLRGMRWIVGSGIHRLWLGSYEPEKMALAVTLVRPGDQVFDIGANVGIYTLLFSQRVGSSGHVVSFEPEPRNVAFLRRHIQLNASSNVTTIQAAVSSSSGTSRFDPSETSSTGRLAASGRLEVRTMTLDEFVAASGRTPDLLKIDVEGAEMDVLFGAEKTITRAHPTVLLATHSEALKEDCTEFLTRRGYSVRALHHHGEVAADELVAVRSYTSLVPPSETRRFRLAAVTSHPVQYQAPLFQRLASRPDIDLIVYYGHNGSVVGECDRDFGVTVKWDRPLLKDYASVILSDRSHGRQGSILRAFGIIGTLMRGRYDAVFIHSYGTLLSLAAYVAAWLSRTPVLLRTESELIRSRSGAVTLAKQLFLRVLFRGTSAFLVIGEANRRFYRSFGIPDHRLFNTPYAVDNQFFHEQAREIATQESQLNEALNLPTDAPIICFSGKFIERKRPLDLLRAYAILCGRGHRASLLLIGDGPLRGELEAFVEKESLSNVRFTGFCNQTELSRYYAASDIFVLPSRFETWGLVVNEAMLFGLPVAVTENVGCRFDLVTPGETGAVFRVADVDALTDILSDWVTNPTERRRIGRAAAARVEEYSQEACVVGTLAALRHASPTGRENRL